MQPDWTLDHTYHAWQAYIPWPGLSTFFEETKVALHRVSKSPEKHSDTPLSWHIKD